MVLSYPTEEMGQKARSRGKRMDEVYLGGIRNRVGLLHYLH